MNESAPRNVAASPAGAPPSRELGPARRTMKAIVQDHYASQDLLQLWNIDKPVVGMDDVIVRLHAAGLHIGDWHVMTGLSVVLHIFGSVIFCVLGALPFLSGLRGRCRDWHRGAGPTLIACGLVAALAGAWMTAFYSSAINQPASFDSPLHYSIRLLAGSATAMSLCLGFAAIRKRDIPRHRAWMLRRYALVLGAGKEVVTHLPWYLLPDIRGEVARTLLMAAGWALNLAVAEWSISSERQRRLS